MKLRTLNLALLYIVLASPVGVDPPVPKKDRSIPYCDWKGTQFYLPCMYSSKEYRA